MQNNDTLNDQLDSYRNQIENIADQLCLAVKGEFGFTIKIEDTDESIQKLCMLINFVLDSARRSLASIEEKNAKLTELDKLKSDFIANISHELRTPLTLIMGPLEKILYEASALEPDQKEDLRRMQRNALRLYMLVNDVLDFSKLESGKFAVYEEMLDLKKLIMELIDDAQGLANERKITLIFSGPDEAKMLLDRRMMGKILINLVSNALKFTPEGGCVETQLLIVGTNVQIIVEDSGIGIPAAHLERLFERFHQVNTSSNRAYEGTGLGLAIVNEFSKLLGGSVRVESEVGKGSKFTVTLPIRLSLQENTGFSATQTNNSESSKKLSPKSFVSTNKIEEKNWDPSDGYSGKLPLILIVDDNDDMRVFIGTLLQDNYEIVFAKNGREALEYARKHRPQVILSDVMMPIMDGYELTKQIKSDPYLQHTSIILITAKSGNESIISALEVGADDYVCKPFSTEELKARTAAAVRSYRAYMKLVAANSQLGYTKNNLAKSYKELEAVHKKLKETQSQLLQHSKLASIGQLAAGVAHEINNPIAFVISNTELLRKYFSVLKNVFEQAKIGFDLISPGMGDKIFESKQQWENLCEKNNILSMLESIPEVISESSVGLERIADIVSDLKSFSHADQSGIEYTDINKSLDLILKIIGSELRYKCNIQKQYGELPQLQCNPRQLNQVFLNILINAGQAIKDKGEIIIYTEAKNDEIIVSISDTGEGISPEHLDKLFDPFFTTKPVGKGTGLGLSISYNIIQEHGGRVDVQSKKGEGTTFTVYLPMHGIAQRKGAELLSS